MITSANILLINVTTKEPIGRVQELTLRATASDVLVRVEWTTTAGISHSGIVMEMRTNPNDPMVIIEISEVAV